VRIHPARRRASCLACGLGAAALALAGCAVGPDFERPPPPRVEGYVPGAAAPAAAAVAPTDANVPARWWRMFAVPALDALVEQAWSGSPTLAAASARLQQSEAARRAGDAVFLPSVGVGLGASRQRETPLQLGQLGPSSLFNLYTLTGSVGYVLDLFGGQRRAVESLRANVDVQRQAAVAAYLTLTATVVDTGIALAGYGEQVAASQATLDALVAQEQLTAAQVQAGTTPYATLLAVRSQRAGLEAALAALQLRADQAGHLLATLVGRAPGAWQPPALPLAAFTLPQALPPSLPSQLVRQRPDILAAEARLHVASAEIGVATADLFPTLTLSGALGHDATRWPQLGDAAGRFWSGGAELSVPLFAGGRSWFGRRAALDAYQAALADYRQAVLGGLQQVADALQALDRDAVALAAATEAADSQQAALQLAQVNERAGVVGEQAVLDATVQWQAARQALAGARAQRLQDVVALYVALGGGWWNATEPVPGVAPVAVPEAP